MSWNSRFFFFSLSIKCLSDSVLFVPSSNINCERKFSKNNLLENYQSINAEFLAYLHDSHWNKLYKNCNLSISIFWNMSLPNGFCFIVLFKAWVAAFKFLVALPTLLWSPPKDCSNWSSIIFWFSLISFKFSLSSFKKSILDKNL